uniref:Uncharacterized protein n=1 Tax=Rhizophora mucronata TaxID=61149 RepID=A0A2P2R423_RHIMU
MQRLDSFALQGDAQSKAEMRI